MEEPFVLEVDYKEIMHEYPAQLQMIGFTHRFIVTLPMLDLWFERDEEGSYRAIVPPGTDEKEVEMLDRNLIGAIAARIEAILR